MLILTTYESDSTIIAAIEAGASGYLLKAAPAEEFAPAELTPRELDVLRLVAAGCSNRAIGERLFIGEATVKSHLLRVFEKLGVHDRTRAVTLAMERGLL